MFMKLKSLFGVQSLESTRNRTSSIIVYFVNESQPRLRLTLSGQDPLRRMYTFQYLAMVKSFHLCIYLEVSLMQGFRFNNFNFLGICKRVIDSDRSWCLHIAKFS